MSIFIFLVVSLISVRCSVDGLTSPSGETKTIKVKEYITNLPVSGVKFTTYYCKEFDFLSGYCTDAAQLSSCTTNNNGACDCAFPENPIYHIITIHHNDYWPINYNYIPPNNEYFVQAKAWVTLNFKTDAEYPSTNYFSMRIIGEYRSNEISIYATNNSSIVLKLFGNEENRVVWEFYGMNSQIINSGVFTLNPQKLEHLTYTLHY